MRITGGILKDRLITSPASSKVRPTTDKLRSSVFSILGDRLKDASILDAFAGTGAFGIESYSRGASGVVFLDSDISAVKSNLHLLPPNFPSKAKRGDYFKSFKDTGDSFDIIFIDPPYGLYDTEKILRVIFEGKLLKSGGVIVYEEFFKTPFSAGVYFEIKDERRYGDTTVRFLEAFK